MYKLTLWNPILYHNNSSTSVTLSIAPVNTPWMELSARFVWLLVSRIVYQVSLAHFHASDFSGSWLEINKNERQPPTPFTALQHGPSPLFTNAYWLLLVEQMWSQATNWSAQTVGGSSPPRVRRWKYAVKCAVVNRAVSTVAAKYEVLLLLLPPYITYDLVEVCNLMPVERCWCLKSNLHEL